MRVSENNRLSKRHFDWQLLVASYMLALYGVLAITIATIRPSARTAPCSSSSWTRTTAACSCSGW